MTTEDSLRTTIIFIFFKIVNKYRDDRRFIAVHRGHRSICNNFVFLLLWLTIISWVNILAKNNSCPKFVCSTGGELQCARGRILRRLLGWLLAVNYALTCVKHMWLSWNIPCDDFCDLRNFDDLRVLNVENSGCVFCWHRRWIQNICIAILSVFRCFFSVFCKLFVEQGGSICPMF